MKRFAFLCMALWLGQSACDAGLAGLLSQERRDWSFIESVGGMTVRLHGKELDVDCDVSGVRPVTRKPTSINSGIGVRKLKWTRVGGEIRLSLVTSVFERGMSSSCGSIDLSTVPPGSYTVQYVDRDGTRHALGKVELSERAVR